MIKFHPDKNFNNPNAGKDFIKVKDINDILLNEQKHFIYDRFGDVFRQAGNNV